MTAVFIRAAYAVAVNRGPHDAASPRQEPFVGDMADVRFRDPGPDRRRRVAPSTAQWRWWLLGGMALLVLLVVLFRSVFADAIIPKTRAQALIEQGARALAVGNLSASDGSGARELYEAAIAIDPDRPEARAGLVAVAAAALQRARDAVAVDRFDEAHESLQLARALAAPRSEVDAVAAALRTRESAHAGIDGLVARGESALQAGRLDGDDEAALPLFARVLELQPGHADALRGREDAIGSLLDDAREGLRSGNVAKAAEAIAIAAKYDPGHVDLPDTQARLVEELEALHRRADEHLSHGRIDAAVQAWRTLLDRDPLDAEALAGLQRAAEAHAARARRLASDFRFADADAALRSALALAPDNEAVRVASMQVERSRRAHRGVDAAMPAAQRRREVTELLRQAAAAEERGDLLTPPGDSAYDKLRAAQSLAPADPAVRQAAARLLPQARRCFDGSLSANDLGRARNCLDMRDALGEDEADVAQARRRLALRWLAIGDERLGAGQLDGARAALQSAQGLDPAAPGIAPFRERLRAAAPVRQD